MSTFGSYRSTAIWSQCTWDLLAKKCRPSNFLLLSPTRISNDVNNSPFYQQKIDFWPNDTLIAKIWILKEIKHVSK